MQDGGLGGLLLECLDCCVGFNDPSLAGFAG
jgi:hypothetical protein